MPVPRSSICGRTDRRDSCVVRGVLNGVALSGQYPLIPAGPQAEVALDAAGLTDIGEHRDKNEDAYLIGTLHRSLIVHDATASAEGWFAGEPAGTLLVVADGMGGQGGGEIASRTAVNAVSSYLLNALPWAKPSSGSGDARDSLTGVRRGLFSALVASDQVVRTTGAKSGTPHMGTTLTAALVLWPVMYVAHVGDTRCYLLRAGKLHRLTTDHNLAERLGPDESRRNTDELQNILWNTLGASDELPRPELSKLDLLPGDTLLLCSDGLNKHVTDEKIQEVLDGGGSSRACCARLVELALDGGGTDNVTALVARLKAGVPATAAAPQLLP
jgi:serine/threonine protein phosphatase PrpC